ncbi:MAG: endonuclease/exonuclease/phosphatase family protein [Clostridia bacterium]|nr:endonuclease/exonuclease/phosphatase family protein [Clostridia bacterium]
MKIKVFSFNIRMDNTNDGINYFPHRTDRIKELIDRENPDLIGFQETREMARKWLSENLKEYTLLGCGRLKGFKGEGVTLAYKRDKFDLFSYNTEWLSTEPAVPESTYGGDQSPCPRVLQYATLIPRDGTEPFAFFNVHLDHIGKDAKKFGSMQTLQRILAQPYRFILTGDFNALPDDGAITLIKNCKSRKITDISEGLGGSFHDWGKREDFTKIDYIFTDFEKYENVHLVRDEHPNGVYYTDHYIVSAEIEI